MANESEQPILANELQSKEPIFTQDLKPVGMPSDGGSAVSAANAAIVAGNVEVKKEVAEAVTNTVILEAILGIVIVAFVLTLLELSSIIYIVFPALKTEVKTMLQSQSSESMHPLKPLIQTLATRETGFTERANSYIQIVAWGFAFLLLMGSWFLLYWINNEYRLQGKPGAPRGTFGKVVFWSFVTIVGIAIFQGFGCIAIGLDSNFCSSDSFAVVSAEWKQNDNFSHIALSTGICDDVADTGSFTNEGFDTILSLYLAQQLANQTSSNIDSDASSTIFKELASDEAQDMLNDRFNRLEKFTGVQERT